jgi:hypothetical protein
VLPKEKKIVIVKALCDEARQRVKEQYQKSMVLHLQAVENKSIFSVEDAARLIMSDSDVSIIQMVKNKLHQVQNTSKYSKKIIPFLFFKYLIKEDDIYDSIVEAHEKINTIQRIQTYHSRLGEK